MPYSSKKKLLFIHIPKNAGSSISVALEQIDDPNTKRQRPYSNHLTAQEYKALYPKRFHNYYKFCIVRNPWDRMVSTYEYVKAKKSYWHDASLFPVVQTKEGRYFHSQRLKKNGKLPINWGKHMDYEAVVNKSFNEVVHMLWQQTFCEKKVKKKNLRLTWEGWFPQHRFICDKQGKVMVDKIFYYEDFNSNEEFQKLIPNLPHVNKIDRKPYQSYYKNPIIRKKVYEIYKRDVELFNYTFEKC